MGQDGGGDGGIGVLRVCSDDVTYTAIARARRERETREGERGDGYRSKSVRARGIHGKGRRFDACNRCLLRVSARADRSTTPSSERDGSFLLQQVLVLLPPYCYWWFYLLLLIQSRERRTRRGARWASRPRKERERTSGQTTARKHTRNEAARRCLYTFRRRCGCSVI